MKNLLTILVLALMVMPMTASALTFEKPDRTLTPAELKLGSIYRGCIGFHCLEDAPYLEVALETKAEGEIMLTVSTNAREGVVVLMTTSESTTTCLEEVGNGMEKLGLLAKGCTDIDGQASIMRTVDQAEGAFGRLKLTSASNTKLLSVIAY